MQPVNKENLYFDIIGKCNYELDSLANKVDMIRINTLKTESCDDTPSSTELEHRLNALLNRIKSLREDTII